MTALGCLRQPRTEHPMSWNQRECDITWWSFDQGISQTSDSCFAFVGGLSFMGKTVARILGCFKEIEAEQTIPRVLHSDRECSQATLGLPSKSSTSWSSVPQAVISFGQRRPVAQICRHEVSSDPSLPVLHLDPVVGRLLQSALQTCGTVSNQPRLSFVS